ncbi:unnamed protein product [Nezara viridula]|uniref:Uncharacterized protein n=1 Tax=Nezara viridula TaxID=85310 RepID=A0A9P0HE51_NEZVI|nr:unnamed protein product [Nezara viridula]
MYGTSYLLSGEHYRGRTEDKDPRKGGGFFYFGSPPLILIRENRRAVPPKPVSSDPAWEFLWEPRAGIKEPDILYPLPYDDVDVEEDVDSSAKRWGYARLTRALTCEDITWAKKNAELGT